MSRRAEGSQLASMPGIPRVRAAILLGLALALPSSALVAQQGPPPPGPLRPFVLPEVTEATLSNGIRVVVVPNREVPLVTVNLVLPGGQGVDPAGVEGVGLVTASLLESGTSSRSFREIVEALDGLGAALNAGATADWTEVTLTGLTDAIDPALEIMSDVVRNPIFPEERVALVRQQALSALAAQNSQAPSVASRTVARIVYGDHRYGKQTTTESLEAIDRGAVQRYHEMWYRPGSALLVVAGDVDPGEITAQLESAFGSWDAGASPEIEYGTPARSEQRIILVHKPGSVQAEVRIAHLLPEGDDPVWTPLQVMSHYLGSQPSGRLFQVLREQRGFTYSVGTVLSRRRDRGLFELAFASRNEVLGEALGEAFGVLREVRSGDLPEANLERTRRFLTGSWALQNEVPQQIAGRIATNRLFGLPTDEVERYRDIVGGLTMAEGQRALQRAIDPDRAAIIVVGDALVLQPQLVQFGPVRIENGAGEAISMADLIPAEVGDRLDARPLQPAVYRYGITLQGQPVGNLVRTVEGVDSVRTVTSEMVLGPQQMDQTVTFTAADFDFRRSTMAMTVPGTRMSGDVARNGDRIRGTLDVGAGPEQVDIPVPDGVLVSDMVEIAAWLADLEVGLELTMPVASVSTGTVANATLRVAERTEITVPAGTFDVFRVVISGADAQVIWARAEAPHLPIRVSPEGQPILIELLELPGG